MVSLGHNELTLYRLYSSELLISLAGALFSVDPYPTQYYRKVSSKSHISG